MTVFIFAFVVMLLVVAGMAVGAMVQKKPLKGSCGGLNTIGMKQNCAICGGDDEACEKEQKRQRNKVAVEDIAYDATNRR
ncbi:MULTISPECIES: (Na+)-NQR maturation NqrM [unclassified Microbulbifer]|uniref:(Na+)-NQR maturation NqrM n=1 Tax=Microbulbifer spongiae TaxID=2944933 RepID=A0ABY9EBN4_9GAMM|nr:MULTISPECIES: (Na+)-NQR maturation NqrM [unclassified Microbulbifer]MDP5210327.1 (Na+)-NQR maturation NqrM [Microbulbifer sp. 2205BS26-8]WKD48186.1 (Na+)-NQR maturation NqrM [Microbulbifer sp. MI-G]